MQRICLFVAIIGILLSAFTVGAQGFSVNTTGARADSSAMIDISSTNKGLLPPRMTTIQRNAILHPAAGLVVYNTDCDEMNYFSTLAGWRSFSGGGIATVGAPTATSYTGFTANWIAAPGNVSNYFLDVSTSSTFATYLPGYQNLSVGNVLSKNISFTCTPQDHFYRVRAQYCSGQGDNSATQPVTGVGVPSTVAATTVLPNSFTANWTAPADSVTGYYLDVSTSSTFSSFITGFNNLSVGNVLSKSVTFPCGSATYYYRVRSIYCSGQYSSYSNVTTVAAGHGTATFAFTGSAQSFTVPCGITAISVMLVGADGGEGGTGALVTGTLTVTPASVLTVIVGGAGYRNYSTTSTTPGGYGGGGQGGIGGYTYNFSTRITTNNTAASGGGRSAIQKTTGTDAVTAGGGGGGIIYWAAGGGGGASDGGDLFSTTTGGGRKGTTSAGGAGGTGDVNGSAGTAYQGGDGGSGSGPYFSSSLSSGTSGNPGGGGGGGYYGGGGGCGGINTTYNYGGGGGGSSYITGSGFTGTNTPGITGYVTSASNGQVIITY